MLKILVVDDEPSILEPLKKIFSSSGYETYAASTGEECLRIFKEKNPDAVFLDILLPDIDGIELLKQIKAIKPKTIVTMVSTKKDEATMADCFKNGAVDYITKPFYSETLKDIIAKNIHLPKTPKYQNMDKPRILICDDEDDMIVEISRFIQRRYFADVVFATSAEEAINLCREQTYDLIFMDLKMPGMNGIEALAPIREILPGTPVFIVSGYSDPEIVTQAIKAGAEDFLAKPFSPETLNNKIEKKLREIGKFSPKRPC